MLGSGYSMIRNCPRICVCSLKFMAFVAALRSFRIARKSLRPGIPDSSCCRTSWNLLHLKSTYITVCLPSPRSQYGSVISESPLWGRKSLNPIFSVRIWISKELCRLLRFSCKPGTLCVGFGDVSVACPSCLFCDPAVLPLLVRLLLDPVLQCGL